MVPLAPRAAAANGTTRYEFFRHGQIYQSDVLFRPRSEVIVGSAPGFIVLMSLRPAIPRQVGLHQSPPPLHRLEFILNPAAETVNHHPVRAGEFSTGEMLSPRQTQRAVFPHWAFPACFMPKLETRPTVRLVRHSQRK